VAKTASARSILALAVAAALALSGCGGDSSESETGASVSSDAAATAGGKASLQSTSADGQSAAQSQEEAGSKGPDGGSGGSSDERSASRTDDGGNAKVVIPKGEPEPGITQQQRNEVTIASILLESPDLQPVEGGVDRLPVQSTCDGEDSWPSLRWEGIPPETSELLLFVVNLQPVDGTLFFDWAIGGLDPSLDGIEAGDLPKGAVVGRNSFGRIGYSVCPPEGRSETMYFTLFALPRPLSPERGFDPLEMRKRASAQSANAGLMAASYARR
jgi:phosphatidylethanolamine-binding protein (PEBP) family uncharacterized protein